MAPGVLNDGAELGMLAPMKPVGAVIFDLGRVLVDVDFSRGLFPLLVDPRGPTHPGQQLARQELFCDFGTGHIDPAEFHRRLCRMFDLDLEYPEFVRRWCDVFSEVPGMAQLLARIPARVPVGLLSDTDPLHWAYCRSHFSYLSRISEPTLSFEVGALKPDPRCYREAVRRTGMAASQCLFVDDLPANVDGARACGLQALVFTGAADLERQLAALDVLPGARAGR
jgi:putative hydrolase of the HAD superfamily